MSHKKKLCSFRDFRGSNTPLEHMMNHEKHEPHENFKMESFVPFVIFVPFVVNKLAPVVFFFRSRDH